MKIHDIHLMYNNPLREENLISIFDIEDSVRDIYGIPSDNDIREMFDRLKIDTNYLFFDKENSMNPVLYYKDTVYVPIDTFNEEIINMLGIDKRINTQTKVHKDWILKGEFESLFSFIDTRILFKVYKDLFEQIPNEKKFDIFIDVYVLAEYGFGEFLDRNFIEEVLKYKNNNRHNIENIRKHNKYINIYRGSASNSSKIEDAYSWTTNINTALFFATRFNQTDDSSLYKASVHMDDIIDYIEDRGENEVLVFYDKLKDVEKIELLNFQEIFDDRINEIYQEYIVKLKPLYFHNPKGIHGILHAKRVLLLTLLLSKLCKLSEIESQILCDAAIYHDIGRVDDFEDEVHGKLSYMKLESLGLVNENKEYMNTLKYIITGHSISDTIAFASINKYKIKDKKRAIRLLKIFKDTDGLDRVRIDDLDVNYLRNDESMRLVGVAKQLLSGIK